jgi:putative chitinase
MAILTAAQLRKMCKGKPNAANMASVLLAINTYGPLYGLDNPVNLSQFLPQILHESGEFRYDREIWGPTPAQKRYEGRKDLGNTQKGDGSKFRGFGPIQLTGRGNVTRYHSWCQKLAAGVSALVVPNFISDPSKINIDPWEGLSAIWYWDQGNPTGKSLNRLAANGNLIEITKKINGGTNGLAERIEYYGRVALVLLGYGTSKVEIIRFQQAAKIEVDGSIGDETKMALHKALGGINPYATVKTVEVKVPEPVAVPVKVESLDTPILKTVEANKELITTIGVPTFLGLTGSDWRVVAIVAGCLMVGAAVVLILRSRRAKAQNVEVARIERMNAIPAEGATQ